MKLIDFWKPLVHVLGGQSQDGTVQINVIAPREFGIEAGAQLQKSGDSAVDGHLARGRLKDAGTDLQKSAFSRSVFAHDAKRLPPLDLEGNVAQGPIVGVETPLVEGGQLFEAIPGRAVDRVTL